MTYNGSCDEEVKLCDESDNAFVDRTDFYKFHAVPKDHKPPKSTEIRTDTEYPNMNSFDYMTRIVDHSKKLKSFYQTVDINSEGKIILGCNDYVARVSNGSVWGFEDADTLGIQDKSSFSVECDLSANVMHIKYFEKTLFLAALDNGRLEIWSTKSSRRDDYDYCLFKVGSKNEHYGIIKSFDFLESDGKKAVSCGNDRMLKIWDIGTSDLFSIHTIRDAHTRPITGVSTDPNNAAVFATASMDKSILMWDYRVTRPASVLYNKYDFGFTTLAWLENKILIGDEDGFLHALDPRNPQKLLKSFEVYNRPISKIKSQGDHVVVIGMKNVLQAYSIKTLFLTYKSESARNIFTDGFFAHNDDDCFYSIGWNKIIKKHLLKV